MAYQIKMVSEILGIPRNTLIAWERRYAIVEPTRTDGGYRVYSDADMAVLRRVQGLMDQGYKIGEACDIVSTGGGEPVGGAQVYSTDRGALTAVKNQLKECLLSFDRAGADLLGARLLVVPFEQVMDDVYMPLLRDVGQEWEQGRVTVAQEHFCTAYCREKLLVMRSSVQQGSAAAPEITCATPPDELHELGLLALALRLSLRGFRIVYLGASLPTAELVSHVNARRPAALCVSMTHFRLPEDVMAYARELRAGVDPGIRIAIGGRATEGQTLHVPGVTFAGHLPPSWLDSVDRLGRSSG